MAREALTLLYEHRHADECKVEEVAYIGFTVDFWWD